MGNQQSMRYTGHDMHYKYEPEGNADSSPSYKEDADASTPGSPTAFCAVEAEISVAEATRPPNSENASAMASTRAPKLTVETWDQPAGSTTTKHTDAAQSEKAVDAAVSPHLPLAATPVRPNRRVEDVYDIQSLNIGRYDSRFVLDSVAMCL